MKLPTIFLKLIVLAISSGTVLTTSAAQADQTSAIARTAEEHATRLAAQSLGPGAEIKSVATAIDRRLRFPACPKLVADAAPGTARWGKTTIEVYCVSPRWRLYVPVTVSAHVKYLAAASYLPAGHMIGKHDVETVTGDMSRLPRDAVLADARIEGRRLASAIPVGQPYRLSFFTQEYAVTAGQKVKIIIAGNGFTINADGTATSSAGEGEMVRVLGPNGKPLNGRAKTGGTVEVAWQ